MVNFVNQQIFAWVIGIVAVIGVAVRFFSKKQGTLSKLLVAGSVIAGMYFLYLA